MKKYLLILILLFCFESTFTQELSELAKKTVKEALLNKNSLGNYFVVAFPPNDTPNNDLQTMAIYMTSQEKAKVKISSPEGVLAELQIPGLNVKNINSTNVLNWNMMLNDNDEHIINNKGIIIESDKAISVYVLSSKGFTSEGYLAIPVKSWGTEYIHCSYWDFNNVNRNWKTGLTVLASEDRTKIEIVLKGKGKEHKTLRGTFNR